METRFIKMIHLLAICWMGMAATATTLQFGDFTYEVNNPGTSTVTITGYTGAGGAVIIPDTIDSKVVTHIGYHAFFNHGSGLTSITIPDSVTAINHGAFQYCSGLTNVVIDDGVTTIGSWAFSSCSGLTNIVLPDSVITIGDSAFKYCSNLKNIVIPDSVTDVGYGAFASCSGLTNVVIGSSVTTIGGYAFSSCSGLMNIMIGDRVTTIANSAFAYCSGLTNVVIGNSVTALGFGAFESCSGLSNIVIGNSVTTIGGNAFAYCSGLTNVVIGSSVTSLGSSVFRSCIGLIAITVDTNNPEYSSVGGILFNKDQTELIKYPEGKAGSYTIPGGVMEIASYAFQHSSGLTAIMIPYSVTAIGSWAFNSCSRLTSISVSTNNPAYSSVDGVLYNKVLTELTQYPGGKIGGYTIPSSITSLDWYPFAYCNGLMSVTIPDSVTTIKQETFRNCSGLTNILIGTGVTSIDHTAFLGCSNLAAITVDLTNSAYSSIDGVLFNKDQTWLIQYPEGRFGSYMIPDSVITIGFNAFANCSGLTNIVIGSSVTFIRSSAFYSCNGLTSITIPYSVSAIESSAFRKCSSLTAIAVDLNNNAFGSLDGILFNKNMTRLIQYPEGKAGSYTIPDSVTAIGARAFEHCIELTNVVIGSSVTTIGGYAFSSCSGLINIVIPDSVTTIGGGAFSSCSGLMNIVIPDSVTAIDHGAFQYCSGLRGVYFKGSPPDTGFYVFERSYPAVYYLTGTSGWGATFDGRPTVRWNPRVQTGDSNFGMQDNTFGFNIAGHGNELVKVESCTNLVAGTWEPAVMTNLTAGSVYFSDPDWTTRPNCFYRLTMP